MMNMELDQTILNKKKSEEVLLVLGLAVLN